MRNINWAIVIAVLCAILSTLADTVSTYYWKKQTTGLFVATLLISPLVFFAFGYVGNAYGLAIASCLTNSLVVVGPVFVGLVILSERRHVNLPVLMGIALVIIGIITILYYRDTG